MFREVCLLASGAGVMFGWLSATLAPIVRSARSLVVRHGSFAVLALAVAAATLWTIVLAGSAFVVLSCDPRVGAAVLASAASLRDGLVFGAALWIGIALLARTLPRLGDSVEVAAALAVVALVKDDDRTLARVEHLYRRHALGRPNPTLQSVRVGRVRF